MTPNKLPNPMGQCGRVYRVMKRGTWMTLPELQSKVGGLTTAISARIRELRNNYRIPIERRIKPGCRNTWQYRIGKDAV